MDRVEEIKKRLKKAFVPVNLEIIDESRLHAGHEGAKSGGGHFAVTIVSSCFEDRTPLMRHRMVYEALGELMNRDIHALRINALTPEEL